MRGTDYPRTPRSRLEGGRPKQGRNFVKCKLGNCTCIVSETEVFADHICGKCHHARIWHELVEAIWTQPRDADIASFQSNPHTQGGDQHSIVIINDAPNSNGNRSLRGSITVSLWGGEAVMIYAHDILMSLNFTNRETLIMELTHLQNIETLDMIPFEDGHVRKSRLQPGATFRVVTRDVRVDELNLLSADQLREFKAQFKAMDRDLSGRVLLSDCYEHFTGVLAEQEEKQIRKSWKLDKDRCEQELAKAHLARTHVVHGVLKSMVCQFVYTDFRHNEVMKFVITHYRHPFTPTFSPHYNPNLVTIPRVHFLISRISKSYRVRNGIANVKCLLML
jgi:hypothetical protein